LSGRSLLNMDIEELKLGKDLDSDILKVLSFYSLYNQPLSALEIWNDLERHYPLLEIIETLSCNNKIKEEAGFYSLSADGFLWPQRQEHYNHYYRKVKIASRYAKIFSYFPGVRAVIMANAFGRHNLRDDSDIDFLIIAAPGHLWLSRFYCTGIAKILGKRPKGGDKRDRLCLSFYLSENHLCLNDLEIKPFDPHYFFWRKNFLPLADKDGIYDKFLSANASPLGLNGNRTTVNIGFFEGIAKAFQLAIMPANLKAAAADKERVIISDDILKLHLSDSRRKILEKYGNKIREIF